VAATSGLDSIINKIIRPRPRFSRDAPAFNILAVGRRIKLQLLSVRLRVAIAISARVFSYILCAFLHRLRVKFGMMIAYVNWENFYRSNVPSTRWTHWRANCLCLLYAQTDIYTITLDTTASC